MPKLTEEMQQWLTDNREDYEFYLLHAMMHNPTKRLTMLQVPVIPLDFEREEYAIVLGALAACVKILGSMGQAAPSPPSVEFLRTYVESAARQEGADDDDIRRSMDLLIELQNPVYKEQHYCIETYFEAWYGTIRAKRAARELQKTVIPDVHGQIAVVQTALSAAADAAVAEEEDAMDDFLDSKELERVPRRPTGVYGLDDCLNGGWGNGECYLLFGGTAAGKSIAAGQVAWHEAYANKGYSLVVSTELLAREYAARTVSNAAGIPIGVVQDCENVAQIRQAVAQDPTSAYKMEKVDACLQTFRDRVRVHKVATEDGMAARQVLEREMLKFEAKMGHMPTLIVLDWLGSVADLGGGASSADRAMAWENAAHSCVKFAEDTGIPVLVLAQAVNDSQLKGVLAINDIGIAKGIGKNMVAVIGITNLMDKAGVAAALKGEAEMPRGSILQDQLFCVCKARKGEGRNIQVRRDFRFQRFVAKPRD